MSPLEIAFCAVPMLGHLMPIIPYAEELLHRGHSVTIFHDQDPKYRQKLEQCGLTDCTSVTYDHQQKNAIYDSIQSYYTTQSKKKPDVIVYDFFAVDAADAADAMGVPAIGVFPNPRSINPWAATVKEQDTTRWALWSVAMKGMEAILARVLWCARAKQRWSRSLPLLREQDLYPSPYMPRPILGTMAPAIEFPNLPDAPKYYPTGPSIPSKVDPIPNDLQEWLHQQEKPIVYVAFGTMYKHTPKSIRKLQSELLDSGVAVLWSLPEKDQAFLTEEELPSHFRIQSFVPQVAVLHSGQIAAFVTHCGSNSMNEALLSGVPMVCCPGMADQPANASRLAKTGVGVIAKKKQVGIALNKLLDNLDRFTNKSKKVAVELNALEGAKRGADVIERIAREEYLGPPVDVPGRWPWWPLSLVAACVPIAIAL